VEGVGAWTSIAVGEGGVWAIGLDGLAHIDPETAEVDWVDPGRFAAWFDRLYDVAVAGAAVWTSGENGLFRIDPATDTVVKRLAWGERVTRFLVPGPAYIAAGHGSLWDGVTRASMVVRVDLRTNEILATIEAVGFVPGVVAFGADSVWVLDIVAGEVMRIDPERNEIVARVPLSGAIRAIAANDDGVWVLHADTGTVTRLDPDDPSDPARASTYRVGSDPTAIEIALGAVWVANHGDGTLSRIDPVTDIVETIPVGGPVVALAGDPETGTLWLQLA
jgi:streptogramin lyase